MAAGEPAGARPEDLEARLQKIRSQPKLENQQQTAVVLAAVEETLRQQNSPFTSTGYFAALLSILDQCISSRATTANKNTAIAVVYLLDIVAPHVPAPLLRSKFEPILTCLTPALFSSDAEAPFLRSCIGTLVSLLIVQDNQAWALPQGQTGPRKATAALLSLAYDQRPKVRKRAQDGIAMVLENGPPGPSIDHPAADMCAETALQGFESLLVISEQAKQSGKPLQHDSRMIHALQLIKMIASTASGWPSRSLDSLCQKLFGIAKSKSEYLTMTAFDVFEVIFKGVASETTFSKLPRLLDAVSELQPSKEDSQLLPPWIAVMSRGYDVSSQIEPEETFEKLPNIFDRICRFLTSPSHNIRTSASECLVSFFVNCVPNFVLTERDVGSGKALENLSNIVLSLLDVKYQTAWVEVFTVLGAAFDCFRWRSDQLLSKAVAVIGELRTSESFQSKDQADKILSKAISAMGPEAVLKILPLNLADNVPGQPGKAWLLPLMRDSIHSTRLSHFKKEFVPLSEHIFQRVVDYGQKEKTVEIKIYQTLVHQIWECLPGYCDRPLDVVESFDTEFAELISKLMYQQPEMRIILCRALQALVESLKAIALSEGQEDLIEQGRISRVDARKSLDHISTLSSNLLAVLFNTYGETHPSYRGPVLACIDSFLSITREKDLFETFDRVANLLEAELAKIPKPESKPLKPNQKASKTPTSTSHNVMDLVVAMAVYLPPQSYQAMFNIAATIISQHHEPQLQKKAYKLLPRLAQSDAGNTALKERNAEIREMILVNSEKVKAPARKDRLNAISVVVDTLPSEDLYFVPLILPEVILRTKETAERAREAAYNLVLQLGEKMQGGGIIDNSGVNGSNPSEAPSRIPASLEEYFTILSTGLAGTTPHMISATVTAISRAVYHFRSSLPASTITDLLSTMDLFLSSPTREVVRSVLGFVKVAVIVLPSEHILPRLQSMIPNLMIWMHEHKAHFRQKVKGILERIMRRFGAGVVERHCPEEDRKLVANIRKTRERRKRKKTAATATTSAQPDEDDNDDDANEPAQRRRYDNELDETIYGNDFSDSDADNSGSGESDGEGFQLRKQKQKQKQKQKHAGDKGDGKPGRRRQQTYIHEEDEEPLDLLDRKALANISTTRPTGRPQVSEGKKRRLTARSRVNAEGKLVFGREGDADDADAMDVDDDHGREHDGKTLEQGINAYVDAIKGRDAAHRGRGGRLKFSNRHRNGADVDEEGEDEKRMARPTGKGVVRGKKPRRGPPGRGAGKKQQAVRRRTGGGRIQKRSFNKA